MLFLTQGACFSVLTLQAELADFRSFREYSAPFSPYAASLPLKQFPLFFEGMSPVLQESDFFDRLSYVVEEAMRPKTPSERFYEAYVWREKAQSVYDELKRTNNEIPSFLDDLATVQKQMEPLMRQDYKGLLDYLSFLDSKTQKPVDVLKKYNDFLSEELTQIRFAKIEKSLNSLEKDLSEREPSLEMNTVFDENIDVLETQQGKMLRQLAETERDLDEGALDLPKEDLEKLDFFN